MAWFLARAWEARTGSALPNGADYFSDDDGDTHEANINRVAAAGLTGGIFRGEYGPTEAVTRSQMGTFLARFLAKLVADGHTDYPPPRRSRCRALLRRAAVPARCQMAPSPTAPKPAKLALHRSTATIPATTPASTATATASAARTNRSIKPRAG